MLLAGLSCQALLGQQPVLPKKPAGAGKPADARSSRTTPNNSGRGQVVIDPGGGGGGAGNCTIPGGTLSISQIGGFTCPGASNVSFTLTGNYVPDATGSIDWLSSPAGQNNWTVIPGVSGNSYSANLVSANTDFRVRVTANSSCIVYSTIATVNVSAPLLVTQSPGVFCAPATVNLTDPSITAGSEAGLYFTYADANGPLADPTQVSSGGTYYITAYRDAAHQSCSTTQAVTVVINPIIEWALDADGDGYYPGNTINSCVLPGPGYLPAANLKPGDCNDQSASAHPGMIEICDNIDNDCDGQVDNGTGDIWFRDADGDGAINPAVFVLACTQPPGYLLTSPNLVSDCNDADPLIQRPVTYYADADHDGYGDAAHPASFCLSTPPAGYVNNSTDCNDGNATINPGTQWVVDNDQDGYYVGQIITQCVSPGTGYRIFSSQQPGDCDDSNNLVHQSSNFYVDGDDDGFGAGPPIALCTATAPPGYSANNSDCNDADGQIYPGAPELCDNKDNDCNGFIDDGLLVTWYRDADGDGYGNPAQSISSCSPPAGFVLNNTDCNDGNATINPGALEVCGNGIDDDCDGLVDEDCGPTPVIYIAGTAIVEGNQGVKQAVFLVVLSRKSSKQVTVKYETINGTAVAPADYTAKTGTLVFPANTLSQSVRIDVTGDLLNEANENFKVKLSSPVNANLQNTTATGVIWNDDAAPVVSIRDTTAQENQGTVRVRVQLSAPSGQTIRVKYSTSDGTATAPADYTAQSSVTLSLSPGTTQAYATVPVVADNLNEPTEYFKVKLVSSEVATISGSLNKARVNLVNVAPAAGRDLKPDKLKFLTEGDKPGKPEPGSLLQITASPNPSSDDFEIQVSTRLSEPLRILVVDALGRQVETRVVPAASQPVRMGNGWKTGLYFVAIRQGAEMKILRLVKQG